MWLVQEEEKEEEEEEQKEARLVFDPQFTNGYDFKGLCTAVNSWIDTLLRTTAVKFNEALR
ncbi:hypothetical protein EYF80_022176 [Liparis tanakae]|uniref:Uncharacterized protein n=1 Tax=Liparis tanakae TaxID=230148 RepID=A0A4Z2HPA4_9TELE|nr:hypothetical protein EYF80_022176 [Liparis tanakae]